MSAADAELEVAALFTDPNASYGFLQLADRQAQPLDRFAASFWESVWEGALTADSLAPLRQGLERGFSLPAMQEITGSGRRRLRGLRERRGFAGHWRLTQLPQPADDPLAALEDDKDRARLLLDRYGFLCRELANREGGRLRWAKLFRALCMMELAGEIVSGYFFEQFSGPQFMTPAALQTFTREAGSDTFWINATDPASPCGLGLADARLPQRRARNYLSYLDGELALVVENLGRNLTFHLPVEHPRLPQAMVVLEHLVRRERRLAVATINAQDARHSPYLEPIGRILKGVKDHKQIFLETA